MKRLVACILLCLGANTAGAEESMLFSGYGSMQGFGAPVLKFMDIQGRDVRVLGARGGWIMNHQVVVGGGMYFLVSDINDPAIPDTIRDTDFGYGGLEFEYIYRSDSLVHVTGYLMIGGGSLRVRQLDSRHGPTDIVYVATVAISGELNVTRYFRLNVGFGYREVQRVDTPGVSNDDFKGVEGTIALKLGQF